MGAKIIFRSWTRTIVVLCETPKRDFKIYIEQSLGFFFFKPENTLPILIPSYLSENKGISSCDGVKIPRPTQKMCLKNALTPLVKVTH